MPAFRDDIIKREWTRAGGQKVVSRCWYGRLRESDGGRWRWVKLFTDKRASQRRWEEVKQRAELKAAGVITDDAERLTRPLPVLLTEYHDGLTAVRCSPAHVVISRQMWDRMLALTGWKRFADLTLSSVADLLDKLDASGLTASYRNKHVMRLKAFVNAVLPENWPDPLRKLKRVRERGAKQTRARRAALPDQVNALFALSLPPRRRLAYALAAFNGLRRNEVVALKWADISTVLGVTTISIPKKMGVDDVRDVIPVHPFVLSLLPENLEPGDAVVGVVPDVKTIKKDWKRAGVPFVDDAGRRVDFHALRHTFASALDRSGATRTTKKRLMRHQSGDVTDSYSHAELTEQANALNKVPSPPPVSVPCPVAKKNVDFAGVLVGSEEPTWVSGRGMGDFTGLRVNPQGHAASACHSMPGPLVTYPRIVGGTIFPPAPSGSVRAIERHAGGDPCPVHVQWSPRRPRARLSRVGRIRPFPPGGAAVALREAGYRVVRKAVSL